MSVQNTVLQTKLICLGKNKSKYFPVLDAHSCQGGKGFQPSRGCLPDSKLGVSCGRPSQLQPP
jgi:hypothetical protein